VAGTLINEGNFFYVPLFAYTNVGGHSSCPTKILFLPGNGGTMAKKAKKHFLSADTYISMALGLAVVLLVGAALFNILSKKTTSTNESSIDADSMRNSVPLIHRIQENETLWNIAETYYQNGYHWIDIQKANNLTNPDELTVGQVITIPAMSQDEGDIDAIAASTDNKPIHESVTVSQGESLWSIALREYGNPYRWMDIANVNNLANPDIIHTGNVLRLP
jgi:nucleoid-associated protein YgaU